MLNTKMPDAKQEYADIAQNADLRADSVHDAQTDGVYTLKTGSETRMTNRSTKFAIRY